MRRRLRSAARLAALAVVGGLLYAAPAGAALPLEFHSCNDLIFSSFRLANHLNCAAEDGLRVASSASGITIDLNGRLITGNASVNNGIDNDQGADNVTIRNGTILNFANGVSVSGGEGNVLKDLRVAQNEGRGIELVSSHDSKVARVRAAGNNQGIVALSSSRVDIRDSSATGNGESGILVTGNDAHVENNSATGNRLGGITMLGGTGHVLISNRASLNEDHGFTLSNSAMDRMVRNRSTLNGENGFSLEDSDDVVLRDNVGSSNAVHGFSMDLDSERARLLENVASSNGFHGINSAGDDTVVKRNTANRNGFGANNNIGLGINLDGANPSGGANVANGNDDPDQCDPTSLCA